jgi:putative phosphoribosyl transferase
MLFHDRRHAGRELARRLGAYRGRPGVVVLGLPRGGIPVAYEVARALDAPLDVLVVRKLGVPGDDELAMGAIASGGARVLNWGVVRSLGIVPSEIDRVAAEQERELARREKDYRRGEPPIDVRGRVVILVDDGLATGASVRAAVSSLRARGPWRVVVAAPVGAADVCDEILGEVDDVVCAERPQPFYAVGAYYEEFGQTSDDEVRRLLDEASRPRPALTAADGASYL